MMMTRLEMASRQRPHTLTIRDDALLGALERLDVPHVDVPEPLLSQPRPDLPHLLPERRDDRDLPPFDQLVLEDQPLDGVEHRVALANVEPRPALVDPVLWRVDVSEEQRDAGCRQAAPLRQLAVLDGRGSARLERVVVEERRREHEDRSM